MKHKIEKMIKIKLLSCVVWWWCQKVFIFYYYYIHSPYQLKEEKKRIASWISSEKK